MHSSTPLRILHLTAAEGMLNPNLRDQLIYLRQQGYEVHTASIDGPLARKLHSEDAFPWTALPLTREFAPWKDWKAVRWIERFCREQHFQIVHTHTPKGNLIGQWGARRAGVPIILQTLHGFYFHEHMSWLKRRAWIAIEKRSARFSDHVLCQNPEDVETAKQEGIVRLDQISLLGNGIDLQRFRPELMKSDSRMRMRQQLGLPADALVVGMCGRFLAEKGFPEFLEAGRKLVALHQSLHLLVIGHRLVSERSGEVFDLSRAQATFPPGKLSVLYDREDMPELYGCMDLHVLASHREGFPRVLMEGAAVGLAQVATNIRGCRQAVANGETGLLVPVNDPAVLAGAIERLLADPVLREKMGFAARVKAEREFDQRAVFERVRSCYEKLIAAKLPRQR